jgi:tRNA threonylcarbamoyladenosine biosynthesis protein TsaB
MKLLAIEGALGPFSCCVRTEAKQSVVATAGKDALEAGLATIRTALDEAGVRLDEIERLAIGTGPGSFTGLRIALSYAKALALAQRIPIVGVSSYDILEPEGAEPPVYTVVGGRTGVICLRVRDADGARVRCGPVAEVLAELSSGSRITLVNGTKDVLAALGERGLTVRTVPNRTTVPAEALAEIALHREPAPTPHALRPDYGELPAAKVPKF